MTRQGDKPWSAGVCIERNNFGCYTVVNSTQQAINILQEWSKRGPLYRVAAGVFGRVMADFQTADDARKAFIDAAGEEGILVAAAPIYGTTIVPGPEARQAKMKIFKRKLADNDDH